MAGLLRADATVQGRRDRSGSVGPKIAKGSDKRTLCIFFSPCRTGRLSDRDAMSERTMRQRPIYVVCTEFENTPKPERRERGIARRRDPQKKGRTPGWSAASRQGGSQSRKP